MIVVVALLGVFAAVAVLGVVVLVTLVGLGIVVAIVVAVGYSFFVRRHGESDRARTDWIPTDERFRDPSTDRTMRVWVDSTGERHYVPEQ